MNHEYGKKIVNESSIIGVKKARITNIESQMIALAPVRLRIYIVIRGYIKN